MEITSVTLRLRSTPDSRPELALIGTPRAWADEPVGLNEAAGLGIGGPRRIHVRLWGNSWCRSLPCRLARSSKKRCNPLRTAALCLTLRLHPVLYKNPQHPLGESNLSQLSAFMPSTYKESVMPGGAKSGATADETVEFPHSAATGTGTSLVEVIRLLSVMAPDERAALIDFLKTWG